MWTDIINQTPGKIIRMNFTMDPSSNESSSTNSSCSEDIKDELVLSGCIGLVISSLVGILSNTLGIASLKKGIVELRPVHRFLINLSITEIVVCASTWTFPVMYMLPCDTVIHYIYAVSVVIFSIGMLGQVGSLLLLAIDHYFAIMYPLKYLLFLSDRRCNILIAVQWCIAITVYTTYNVCNKLSCGVYAVSTELYDFTNYCVEASTVYLIYFALVFMSIFAIYIRVLMDIYRMVKFDQPLNNHAVLNKKAIKTTFMILGTYFVFNVPGYVVSVALPSLGLAEHLGPRVFALLNCFTLLNCTCDPLIYSLRMRDVRRGLVTIFSECTKCRGRKDRVSIN